MQMDLGKAFLDPAQHFLVPIDLEIRMQPALHQHSSAAQFDGLADLVIDGIELKNVTFFRRRPFQRTIKGTESAVLGTVIGVINVAVNDVGDHALGMTFAAHGVCFHPDAYQVIGLEHFQSLLLGERHGQLPDYSNGAPRAAPNSGNDSELQIRSLLRPARRRTKTLQATFLYGRAGTLEEVFQRRYWINVSTPPRTARPIRMVSAGS